jgi:hypothetical protein
MKNSVPVLFCALRAQRDAAPPAAFPFEERGTGPPARPEGGVRSGAESGKRKNVKDKYVKSLIFPRNFFGPPLFLAGAADNKTARM